MGISFKKSEKEMLIERSVSIQQYFDAIIIPSGYYDTGVYGVNFEYKATACCPLHDEDTPSFRYYPDTLSFYCFGCGAGGNIVNLHMKFMYKINGTYISKQEAIDFLYTYFIEGKRAVPIVQQLTFEVRKKNSEVDLARYARYVNNLESELRSDRKLDIKTKINIWDKIDELSLLVRQDMIVASDARKEIEENIREIYK